MKAFKTALLFVLLVQSVFSQNIKECKEIAKITMDAFNSKSPNELEKYLSPDFEILSYQEEMAKQILNALIKQIKGTIWTYDLMDSKNDKNVLTLKYSIFHSSKGKQNATFVFDKNSKLKRLDIFNLEVKTN